MYEIRLGADDVARVRFAVSPLWEVTQAVRTLVDPRQQAYHLPWLDRVRPRLDEIDLLPLTTLQPMRGYSPDLIAPSPTGPRMTVQEQLAQVRETPLAHVREELGRALADRGGQPVPREIRALVRTPRVARDRIADALEACWHALVEPHWRRIEDLLAADIAHHSRVLTDGGLARLFPALSPVMTWTGRTLRVATGKHPLHAATRGRGLVLQPTAFGWPHVIVISDVRYQPTVVYPARGVAELWQPAGTPVSGAIARLLGRTRALLLASVQEPASTTVLARRHGLAPATVSEHLSALAAARLVAATRVGRSVHYATTDLGDALLAPAPGPGDVGVSR